MHKLIACSLLLLFSCSSFQNACNGDAISKTKCYIELIKAGKYAELKSLQHSEGRFQDTMMHRVNAFLNRTSTPVLFYRKSGNQPNQPMEVQVSADSAIYANEHFITFHFANTDNPTYLSCFITNIPLTHEELKVSEKEIFGK